MEMEMIHECLIPGMENGNKAYLSTEAIFWISAKFRQGFGNSFEENSKEYLFIAQNDGVDFVWQSKYIVEVCDGEYLCLTSFQPPCF